MASCHPAIGNTRYLASADVMVLAVQVDRTVAPRTNQFAPYEFSRACYGMAA